MNRWTVISSVCAPKCKKCPLIPQHFMNGWPKSMKPIKHKKKAIGRAFILPRGFKYLLWMQGHDNAISSSHFVPPAPPELVHDSVGCFRRSLLEESGFRWSWTVHGRFSPSFLHKRSNQNVIWGNLWQRTAKNQSYYFPHWPITRCWDLVTQHSIWFKPVLYVSFPRAFLT